VVISIFFASRALPVIGVDLPLLWYLVIGLTIYNSVAISEIVRAGIHAVPRGQTEAALALGLSRGGALRSIVLPQAFRIMLPSLIAQLVIVVKDTALGFIIGFEELLRRGEIAVQTLGNPLQMYLLIGAIFFVVNGLLSWLARATEARLRGAGRAARRSSAPRRAGSRV
jgi:glutamate transport system permease protein